MFGISGNILIGFARKSENNSFETIEMISLPIDENPLPTSRTSNRLVFTEFNIVFLSKGIILIRSIISA